MKIHNPIITGSIVISGSMQVEGHSANTVASASYVETAQTASYITASNIEGLPASDSFPYTGLAGISGSLEVTGSTSLSYNLISAATWTAGGAKINALVGGFGAGTQNASLSSGGRDSTNTNYGYTEEYDGTSWTAGGVMITPRTGFGGAGTQTAAFAVAEFKTSTPNVTGITEQYDGTSWTAGGSLITARYNPTGAGTSNAGLAFGGYQSNATEEYNGASWSAGGNRITVMQKSGGAGTQNAALSMGGYNDQVPYGGGNTTTCTEEYNGTSWSAGGALPSVILYNSGVGIQNAALSIAGAATNGGAGVTNTNEYDGTAWTAGGSLIVARWSGQASSAGSTTSAAFFGGTSPSGVVSCTEEYAAGSTTIKTFDYSSTTGEITQTGDLTVLGSAEITGSLGVTGSVSFSTEIATVGAAVWSAGGALATARYNLAGAGTQTAGLAFGGYDAGFIFSCTEEYNGASWSTGGALATARQVLAGAGTQTAGLAFGGATGMFSAENCTEEYNGATWSTAGVGTLLVSRFGLSGVGTQNAALAFGGNYPGDTSTEEYNGASWSTGGALATARYMLAGAGTQNAALAFGGEGSGGSVTCTEEYNGATWSAGGALATARQRLAGAGTQTAALAFGGNGANTCTEEYSPTSTLSLTKTFDYSESTGAVILSQVSSSLNFADDTAAATGGIPLGGLYRNGNFIVIRLT